MDERLPRKKKPERNMALSVVVFIQLAASGDKLGLDDATN
jgi:hypothetical protein